jgi:hypothetical protein
MLFVFFIFCCSFLVDAGEHAVISNKKQRNFLEGPLGEVSEDLRLYIALLCDGKTLYKLALVNKKFQTLIHSRRSLRKIVRDEFVGEQDKYRLNLFKIDTNFLYYSLFQLIGEGNVKRIRCGKRDRHYIDADIPHTVLPKNVFTYSVKVGKCMTFSRAIVLTNKRGVIPTLKTLKKEKSSLDLIVCATKTKLFKSKWAEFLIEIYTACPQKTLFITYDGQYTLLHLLLGCYVNIVFNYRNKPVALQLRRIIKEMCRKSPFYLSCRDKYGNTPLHIAYRIPEEYLKGITGEMIKAGAKENVKNKMKLNPKEVGVLYQKLLRGVGSVWKK